jgi:ribosome-associated heat shock protein Hsp15
MATERSGDGRLRIDKWLWFARLAKTRTLAQKLAASGRVRVNRERNEAVSRSVKIGDTLTIGGPTGVRVFRIVALGVRRGPPAEARGLYDDLSPPPAPAAARSGPRPTKHDRRAIDAFRLRPEGGYSENDD